MSRDDKVGRKAAGFICAPAGSLTWRDVSPDPFEAGSAIARALQSAGVNVAVASEESLDVSPPSPLRVVGSIVGIRVNACVPERGFLKTLGGRQSLSAAGWIKVKWRVFEIASGSAVLELSSERSFDVKTKALTLPDVVVSVLKDSAGQLAESLRNTN